MTYRYARLAFGLTAGSFALSGCLAASSPKQETPEPPPAAAPTTPKETESPAESNRSITMGTRNEKLADLEQALARAERQLRAQLAPDSSLAANARKEQETAEAPAPKSVSEPEQRSEAKAEQKPKALDSKRCDRACQALASMRRSADHICDMTGAKQRRCQEARSRVEEASALVEQAGCQCESK